MSAQPNLSDWLARRPEGKKPRVAVKKVSGKRVKQLAEYRKLRKEFLAKNPYCQIWMKQAGVRRADIDEDGCILDGGYMFVPLSEEVHHVRGRIGAMLNNTRHWLAVSRKAHRWVHDSPREARILGFLA